MAEATSSLSFRDLTVAVATRKYRGIQHDGDWPTEAEITTLTWVGHTTAEITLADQYLDTSKRIVNDAYKRFMFAHDWGCLTERTTLTAWVTATETESAVGGPAYDGTTSTTITVDAAMFYDSMVGQILTFGTSETTWTIASVTSTTVVVVTGDASGEDAAQEITVTATGNQRLPDDFSGEMIDEKMYFAPDGQGEALVERPFSDIMDLRGRQDLTTQYVWSYGLETVQVGDYTRWNVAFWPRWDTDTTIHYRYRKQICALTSASGTTDYPLGGAEFSTAIREACMMMVEEDRGYVKGPAHDSYNTTLAQAISRDSKNKPRNRGYNGDNSDIPCSTGRNRFKSVTFNA